MNEAADALVASYRAHAASIPRYLWLSEDDRWLELVVCLLSRSVSVPVVDARNVALIWRHLGLASSDAFASLCHDGPEAAALTLSLTRIGVAEEQIPGCLAMLRSAAACVESAFGGKIQVFLRHHVKLMRSELVAVFAGSGLGSDDLKIAITHWLQNVMSAPILLEDEGTGRFCADHDITLAELEQIADEYNLNLALVDDVIALRDMQI